MSVFDGLQSVLGEVFGTDMILTRAATGTTVTVRGVFEIVNDTSVIADGRGNIFSGPVAHLRKDQAVGVAARDILAVGGVSYLVLYPIAAEMAAVDEPITCLLEKMG